MIRSLNVSWLTSPAPGNFGDILSPYILKNYGYDVNFVRWNQLDRADTICVGSIARLAKKGIRVLGSGILSNRDPVDPEANWVWVRGPRTRNKVIASGGKCPEIFGDPALLLPRIFEGSKIKKYNVGIIPHHIDYEYVLNHYPHYRAINLVSDNVEQVILDITECENVISSSLHGLIVANAYGIPAAWVRFNKLVGDNIKFQDYYESVDSMATLSTLENPIYSLPKISTDTIHQILVNGDFL